jgi:chromosome segregation protein
MYLSKIEVIGFKSFAQRINVNFDAGVTAIVGPNGCGKTNIVDAIRWALGEQKYSTLRSDKMEDVIFNGTKNRKPLGLAEVSLTIENTKGILPTEYSEVTITRRVFRSGESEYLLNKTPCRLKDILDLFMDTGMGSDAYSVIELKMVESILSDKTDERRRLFEEAAGVTKYKHRRKAAMRKLEDVQKDLERVNDIVKEVQKTVSSLERQAKKAEQYNDVSSRLKHLEIDLLERELAHNYSKLTPLEAKFQLAQTDKSAVDEALRAQEDEIDSLRAGLRDIESNLAEAQRSSAAQFELIRRVEENVLVANERLNALRATIVRCEEEKNDLRAQSDVLIHERSQYTMKNEELVKQLSGQETIAGRARVEAQDALGALESARAEVERCKDATLKLAHAIVEKRGERERVTSRIENIRGRCDRSAEDTALYNEDIRRNEAAITELTAQDRELRRAYVEQESQLIALEKKKREMKESMDDLHRQTHDARADIERRTSKIAFLEKLIESNEGYSEGVRHLLDGSRASGRRFTTVADTIHADEEYRAAIEAILGNASSALVVDTPEDGYAAMEELAKAGKGKATFLCLSWLPAIVHRQRRPPQGVRAADIAKCDERFRPLIGALLDDVVIVRSVDEAREVLARSVGVRCVTVDGSIVGSGGILRGGGTLAGEGGLIGKREQIDELRRELTQFERLLERIGAQIRLLGEEHDAIDVRAFGQTVKATEKEMTSVEMRIAQLEFEKRRAREGVERNTIDAAALQEEARSLERASSEAIGELEVLENQKSGYDEATVASLSRLEQAEHRAHEATKWVNESEIAVVTLQGDIRNIGRDLERADARQSDIRVTLLRRDEEIGRAGEEIARLTAESEKSAGELASLKSVFDSMETGRAGIEQTYASRRNELHAIELRIKDERRHHDEATSAAHDLEMKIAELRSMIEHVRLRAKEEFELDLELKTYPDGEFVDFAQLREEVKHLKERIRILGAINFAAFDEFTTESERYQFLTQQRDDLNEAEQTLLSTIEEINATAQRIFAETFGKIRENFINIFKELFLEGDECDLKIEEGIDPLEANIEIIAKPRGKRPTSIDLLSGGEKTLTAIALLFAIYLVKPSPFCILDEVDAPLDDSNIDRYTRILKKFAGNTQFIVVTHNKRTMEAASALYGVTMEEEGVSKIVTVRFNQEARVRAATVTN